jgi:cytochrome c-type biogenesis protein CcmF
VSEPRLRYYAARDTTVSVPDIRSSPLRDVYTTVLAVAPDGSTATVRLAVNPMVGLIWAGGALTALGGALSLVRRPARRVPVPATGAVPAASTA